MYSESMSSPRRVLSRKNSDQPRGNITMIGRFTTTQATAAAAVVRATAPSRPVRTPSTRNGSNNSSGYSLAATPSPISTPASTGRLRAHASIAPVAKAIARASKLVNAWKIRIGDPATRAASHTRRPDSPAAAQTVVSQASASPSAAMSKNITTSATTGSATVFVTAV